ncbi:MAG: DUF4832 domain-containing protein [Planctomycetota bacterium]|nr:DUF4832 domain-containing protein [Planctomycetota bacterium]
MSRWSLLLSILFLPSLSGAQTKEAPSSVASLLPMQQVVPAASSSALANPGMGLYLAGTLHTEDLPPEAWFSPLVQIGYFRDDWSVLEPDAEGKYRFDEYFGPIFDLWVKRWQRRVAFRFMSENMHSRRQYVTPKWVFDTGVPSVKLQGLYAKEQIDPVFWDDRYLRIQERFIADLGKYLDGRPGLEFVDIGCIGEWGEMHLARWTPELLQQTGFTTARYIAAYRRLIDAFARAFPHTRVFLNVGEYEAINDYAAIKGLHFRQDGLTPTGPSADVGRRFYRSYASRGVICNYELHSGYTEMKQKGWGVPETFAKGLEDPISYLHINLMSYRELAQAPADVKQAVTDTARRVGFRFVLTQLRCNKTLRLREGTPSRLLLEHSWKNEGVAPCYASYALRWTLTDAQGRVVTEPLAFPAHPTTVWRPGEDVTLKDVITIPAGTPPGVYRLKVAMVEPENPSLRVQLAIAGRDSEGAYDLCPISAERHAADPAVVYEEAFEQGAGGWQATEGMRARVDGAAHGGKNCLRIAGTQPGTTWNYAQFSLPRPVLPASRYRLSCWMRVDKIAPGAPAPYLKIGLADASGKWLTNVQANAYDLDKLGTWQHLVAFVETTPNTAGGHLTIEKGAREGHFDTSLGLDDVSLELLESP